MSDKLLGAIELKTIRIDTVFYDYEGQDLGDEEVRESILGGDYGAVSVYVNDVLASSYGDYYHEKGDVAADAFASGLLFALNAPEDFEILYTNSIEVY
ncbi:hypothetical protein Phi40:1_gp063 [Cellulophaga phage phi40:1]|jgi:hypothetical protein|uniref:Uncharacterized protein n=1 Tax=Cellulophaga phage phi38:1 TaxID=1327977 RepID=S0A1L5_9CAUD|nr:hypothetical protein Phi38:1_gp063 [Cellulophaga phage phi38:1]AGO47928.1 hypothetical protein Phi40:1_gp063 [Cellulophaga phage phi40:1]AGO48093.1 hypothetical protein Phi38:1_gp063 [Cellulophaga phage phi38:1]